MALAIAVWLMPVSARAQREASTPASPSFVDPSTIPERVAPPDVDRSPVLSVLEGGFVGLQSLDVVSTLRALDRGHTEVNPLMRSVAARPAGMIAVKASSSVATVWLVRRLAKRNRVAAVATMAAIDAGYAFIVARNLRVGAR